MKRDLGRPILIVVAIARQGDSPVATANCEATRPSSGRFMATSLTPRDRWRLTFVDITCVPFFPLTPCSRCASIRCPLPAALRHGLGRRASRPMSRKFAGSIGLL
jgi:hypothetical protein